MVDAGLGSSTINVRLSGVRKLVNEARENGLVDPADAERIVSVANVPAQGVRLGHWLTVEQTKDLLDVRIGAGSKANAITRSSPS